jgi:hypothetical protein
MACCGPAANTVLAVHSFVRQVMPTSHASKARGQFALVHRDQCITVLLPATVPMDAVSVLQPGTRFVGARGGHSTWAVFRGA